MHVLKNDERICDTIDICCCVRASERAAAAHVLACLITDQQHAVQSCIACHVRAADRSSLRRRTQLR